MHNGRMIYGYARVSSNGQDLTQQVAQLLAAGCVKVYQEKASAASAERPKLNSPLPKSIFRDGAQPGPADMMISRTPVSAATWPTRAKISAFSV